MSFPRSLWLSWLVVALSAWAQSPGAAANASGAAPPHLATAAPAQPAQPAANAAPSAVDTRIASNIRAHFKIPARVHIEVGVHKPAPELPGYERVTVTLNSGDHSSPHDFYVSSDGKTLAQINRMDISQDPFAPGARPSRGAADAKVTIIVYDDFECPFCARNYRTLFGEIMPQYQSKVRVVYKDFPLDIHPWAVHAAVDANCLFAQSNDAYWDFADYVHENQEAIRGQNRPLSEQFAALDRSALEYGDKRKLDSTKLGACIKAQDDSAVMASENYGDQTLNIDATPTVFINGTRMDGAAPAEDLRAALNTALEDAGVAPPPGAQPAAAQPAAAAKNPPAKGAPPEKPAADPYPHPPR